MSTYKVGQRVRIVYEDSDCCGQTGVIWAIDTTTPWHPDDSKTNPPGYLIDIDGWGRYAEDGDLLAFEAHELAPLTDPAADAFIESIKRLKPYEEPKVAPARVKV